MKKSIKKEVTRQVSCSLPLNTIAKIKKLAKKNKISMSLVIKSIVTAALIE